MMPFNMMYMAIAAGVIYLAGFGSGWAVNGWRWEAKEAVQLKAQADLKFQYEELSRHLVKRYQEVEAKKKVVYRTIKEKVYVETSGKLCFSANAVKLWNEALVGEAVLPPTSTGASEAPGGTGATDTEVLANAVDNFELAAECRDQLNALIDWYEEKVNE